MGWIFVFLLLLVVVASCEATIYITDSGTSLPSRPATFGTKFVGGAELMSRLQYLPHNIQACPPSVSSKSFAIPPSNTEYSTVFDLLRMSPSQEEEYYEQIIEPTDGLPVTILAKRGGCSYEDKALFVQSLSHSVKYLVVYDDRPNHELISMMPVTDGSQVHIGLVAVSLNSGNELQNALFFQPEIERERGGTRILLDGHQGWNHDYMGHLWIWVSLGFLAISCCGSFLLFLAHEHYFGPGTSRQGTANAEAQAARTRPRRRRLTLEQVQEELEECVFETPPADHPSNYLETCAICLDDFQDGELLILLPCNHYFHTNCVTRWLCERSAVCPLCKIEILPEEEEEEDEGEIVEPEPPEPEPMQVDEMFRWNWTGFSSWFWRRGGAIESEEELVDLEEPLLISENEEEGLETTEQPRWETMGPTIQVDEEEAEPYALLQDDEEEGNGVDESNLPRQEEANRVLV